MNTKEITVEEYIRTTLKRDIDDIRESKPYLAFFLIASGVEFLGKCMSKNKSWQNVGTSQEDFETAICKLHAFEKYKKYTSELKKKKGKDGKRHFVNPPISIYKNLRCGLLHAMLPSGKIVLSDGTGSPKETTKRLTLYLDTFYADFCSACDELLRTPILWGKKDMTSIFLIVDETIEDGTIHSNSGNTINML